MYVGGVDFNTQGRPRGWFSYRGLKQHLDNLAVNLPGRHQYRNAAVALAVLELLQEQGFPVTEADIQEGLTAIHWPGRLERLPQDPRIILDGAHNPAAARTLARALKRERLTGRRFLVMGIMADKDGQAILKSLLPLAHTVIFTRPHYFRADKPENLARRAEPYHLEVLLEPEVAQAVHRARSLAGPQDQVVVTGSLYTVGEALEYFEKLGGKGQTLQTPAPPPNPYPHPQKGVDGGI
jgi:dihydrofolate synthase/folylpolyglutamate synthase